MENNTNLFASIKTLNDFDEQETTWLIPKWIPEGQIVLLAAEGGIGKTTLWCNLVAALSNGTPSVLDSDGYTRKPQKVAFLTTEDSVSKKLKGKLRVAGANMSNIFTVDSSGGSEDVLRQLKFGTPEMKSFIQTVKPALCVFDPIQGFVPPDVNMGSRSAMRDCMSPLVQLGEEFGTTFIIVCHTNKRKGAFGRDKISDSSDLWDVARSVIMAGNAEEYGVRYLSNEKNNYAELQETLLFTISDDEQIHVTGTTWKRDRDYTQEVFQSFPCKREDCKNWILRQLDNSGGQIAVKNIEALAQRYGFSNSTLRKAREKLNNEGKTKNFRKDNVCYIQKVNS